MLYSQLTWKMPTIGHFDQRAWKRPGLHALSLLRFTVDGTTRGGWHGSQSMQVMFVLGLEFALSKTDDLAPREITRIGVQGDMTFIGSAAALNRPWNSIERSLADVGHRLRGYWAPGCEQFEDAELPMEVRNF